MGDYQKGLASYKKINHYPDMWQIKLILTFPALFLFVLGVKANHIDGLTIDISSGMDDEETYFVDNFDYSINEDSLRSNFNLSIRQKKI